MATAESDTTVVLTAQQWASATELATRRHEMAEGRGLTQTDGTKSKNALANHIQGAGAEVAVASYCELPWDATLNGFRKIPDLLGCEIRSTRPERPYLRIKMTDKETKASWPFILATYLGNRTYRIEGWIYGYDAMRYGNYVARDSYTGKPEWHVEIENLKTPFTLAGMLAKLRQVTRKFA